MDIHELIGKELRNEASEEELATIEDWKSKDKFNNKLHRQYQSIWQSSADLRPEMKIEPIADWHQFLQSQPKKSKGQFIKWMGLAASFLLIGLLVRFVFMTFQGTSYEAKPDQIATYMLEDGSTVWLNKRAKITYKQEGGFRLVDLEGEAFFDVAYDPETPFIISTGDLKTKVIGTSFNVDHEEDRTIVTVESGKVKVYDQIDQSVLLTLGMVANYDEQTGKLIEKVGGTLNAFSWKTGILVFDNTSIQDVIIDLEQHFEVELLLENITSDAHLTASFDNQSLEDVLSLVEVITEEKIKLAQ